MSQLDDQRRSITAELHSALADPRVLSAAQATLYSQAVRLEWKANGLPRWTPARANAQLQDAVRLLEAAHIASELKDTTQANDMYRRAGDILEWLARTAEQPQASGTQVIPLSLLAAASFQLAGLPAMAAGLLSTEVAQKNAGPLFAAFLSADFNKTLELSIQQWRDLPQYTGPDGSWVYSLEDQAAPHSDYSSLLGIEVIRCIGLIAGSFRWNDESRLERAIKKLHGLVRYAARTSAEYIWLLLRLTADVTDEFSKNQITKNILPLAQALSTTGQEQCLRLARSLFHTGRALLWPSQQEGLKHLTSNRSFALCTPTGSGKTTVAELALLQALDHPSSAAQATELTPDAPLAIYLVPSRALASEVEAKLKKDIGHLDHSITITSIYGGTDWSITDAWLTAEGPTLLICTVEMAESVIRYVGPTLLNRLRLTIIDEAHQVLFTDSHKNTSDLQTSAHRGARLEYLLTRIFSHSPECRAIALSAVAGGSEDSIARWVSRNPENQAVGANYRSTRQIIGALECKADGSSRIRIELVNGEPLKLQRRNTEAYIPLPFPPMPKVADKLFDELGSFIQCHALWAAMQLAKSGRTTLISVAQKIDQILKHLHLALTHDKDWNNTDAQFFKPPTKAEHIEIFNNCLSACEDYCGPHSYEFLLLRLGIATHHGQLPAKVRRLMTEVIRSKITPITIATSTLTEGVNLPFDTILLPALTRSEQQENNKWRAQTVSASEFLNLAGRAGRPGTGFEGITLAVLATEPTAKSGTQKHRAHQKRIRLDQRRLKALLKSIQSFSKEQPSTKSPLAVLLNTIRTNWKKINPAGTENDFINWLENTSPRDSQPSADVAQASPAFMLLEALDSLDLFLLAAIDEAEQLAADTLPPQDLETLLHRIWQNTFAHIATQNSKQLESLIITRGRSLHRNIYPDRLSRRILYQLGLPPGRGSSFGNIISQLESHLRTGTLYAEWAVTERLQFIESIGEIVEDDRNFRLSALAKEEKLQASWQTVLAWWLRTPEATPPPATQVRRWLKLAISGFEYKLGTAVGTAISAIWSKQTAMSSKQPKLDEWRELTGLPWAAFWVRELLAWGTLDPVAAFLMAAGAVQSRQEAELSAQDYYAWHAAEFPNEAEDRLHPRHIRAWYSTISPSKPQKYNEGDATIEAILSRAFDEKTDKTYPVLPLIDDAIVHWLDCAGYRLATGRFPTDWSQPDALKYDYYLEPRKGIVRRIRSAP